ncbi:putative phage tail protein, partial [Pseudomonas japonica]|uniref:putative phage tail protein n=1 Tax=Pseudomonas japonica TaxID=256466 RepID=UPI003A853FC7
MTADDYHQQLFALLPPGIVWESHPDSRLQKLLAGQAQEPARIDERIRALLAEADPRQALETFEEWETSYGLPSACAPLDQSMADRRAA